MTPGWTGGLSTLFLRVKPYTRVSVFHKSLVNRRKKAAGENMVSSN